MLLLSLCLFVCTFSDPTEVTESAANLHDRLSELDFIRNYYLQSFRKYGHGHTIVARVGSLCGLRRTPFFEGIPSEQVFESNRAICNPLRSQVLPKSEEASDHSARKQTEHGEGPRQGQGEPGHPSGTHGGSHSSRVSKCDALSAG